MQLGQILKTVFSMFFLTHFATWRYFQTSVSLNYFAAKCSLGMENSLNQFSHQSQIIILEIFGKVLESAFIIAKPTTDYSAGWRADGECFAKRKNSHFLHIITTSLIGIRQDNNHCLIKIKLCTCEFFQPKEKLL